MIQRPLHYARQLNWYPSLKRPSVRRSASTQQRQPLNALPRGLGDASLTATLPFQKDFAQVCTATLVRKLVTSGSSSGVKRSVAEARCNRRPSGLREAAKLTEAACSKSFLVLGETENVRTDTCSTDLTAPSKKAWDLVKDTPATQVLNRPVRAKLCTSSAASEKKCEKSICGVSPSKFKLVQSVFPCSRACLRHPTRCTASVSSHS